MELDIFNTLNQSPKKISWHDRSEEIKSNFFSIENLDWKKVFTEDPEILGSIINDMLKMRVPGKGRPGKRPALDNKDSKDLFSNLIGTDYSEQIFSLTFNKLKSKSRLSIRSLGDELGMDKMLVHRLLSGKQNPSLNQMERVASYFNKDPSYFLEWRIAYIITFIHAALHDYTESSIVVFKKLKP